MRTILVVPAYLVHAGLGLRTQAAGQVMQVQSHKDLRKPRSSELEELSSHRPGAMFDALTALAAFLLQLRNPAAGWQGTGSAPPRAMGKALQRGALPLSLAMQIQDGAAVEGLSKPSFFDRNMESGYRGKFDHDDMKNDESRTPLYFAAIRERLQQAGPGVLTVLDLGTGPYALMALEAARAGAKRVYAIEADAVNAQLAREAVAAAGLEDVVEIVEGFSTRVSLPEKVDVLVSEIVGSVASEEGLYATIADAHERHVKNPTDPASWIPHRCQTVAAPASYAMQIASGHPAFRWLDTIRRRQNSSVALRLRCNDETLMLLAPPAVLEDVDLTDPQTLLGVGQHALMTEAASFYIDESRLRANEAEFSALLRAGDADEADVKAYAPFVARSFSGIGMWPRLELNPDATIVVEARGKDGVYQASSWRTLVMFAGEQPVPVAHGNLVKARLHVELSKSSSGTEADEPRYRLETSLQGSPDVVELEFQNEKKVENASAKFYGLLYGLADPLRRVYLRRIWQSLNPFEAFSTLAFMAGTTLLSRIGYALQSAVPFSGP